MCELYKCIKASYYYVSIGTLYYLQLPRKYAYIIIIIMIIIIT